MESRLLRPFSLGPWNVYPSRLEIQRHDGPVEPRRVGHKVMAVLCILVREPREVVGREELIGEVWEGAAVTDEAVAAVVYELRKALDDSARQPRFVQTIRKRGYRLLEAPREIPEPDPRAGTEPAVEQPASPPGPSMGGSWPARLAAAALAMISTTILATILGAPFLLPEDEGQLGSTLQAPRPIRTLAVTPLESSGADEIADPLAEDLTRRLIADLSRLAVHDLLPAVALQAPASGEWSFAETGPESDAVIEGSVWRSGDRLWISAQLLDARTDRLLWGGTWERLAEDGPGLQRELALEIAGHVRYHLAAEQAAPARLAAQAPGGSGDRDRADTQVTLAETYLRDARSLPPSQQTEAYQKARTAAHNALDLAADLPGAHLSLASVYFHHDWRWDRAEAHYLSAWVAAPQTSDVNRGFGTYLSAMGRHREAISRMRAAVTRDPTDRAARLDLARSFYMARRFDEAAEQLAAVLELAPDSLEAALFESRLRLASGELEAVVEACRRVLELSGSSQEDLDAVREAFRSAGFEGALRCLVEAENDLLVAPFDPVFLAALEAHRGEERAALEILEDAVRVRHRDLVWLGVDPMLDPLRSSGRFHALAAQLAMTPAG